LGDPVDFVDPNGKNPIILILFLIGLSEYGNSPTVNDIPKNGPTASILLPLSPLAKPAQELCVVTRWQNPVATSLKSGDWVMKGGKNFKNWALSGKAIPFGSKFSNYHVPFKNGREFIVPKNSLKYPDGWEKFKGLFPWHQRQIK